MAGNRIRVLDYLDAFGEKGFHLAVRRETTQGELDFHYHEGFAELVLVYRGYGIHIFENREYPISPGDVFVINGSKIHAYKDIKDLEFFNILFDEQELNIRWRDLNTLPGFQTLFRIEPAALEQGILKSQFKLTPPQLIAAENMVNEMEALLQRREAGCQFHSLALFLELVVMLSKYYVAKNAAEANIPQRMGMLISFFEKHYATPINVEKMGEIVCMSRPALFRHFRRVFQTSPIDFLNNLRLSKAGELLHHSDLSILEIAQRTGFPDSNYFSRIFRKVMNTSPSEFRVAGRNGSR